MTSELSDLGLALFDTDGTTELFTSFSGGLGESESLTGLFLDAGTYFARITGADDNIQMYQLDVSGTAIIPEPASLMLIAAGCTLIASRRRRA